MAKASRGRSASEQRKPIGVILGAYWDNGKENGNYCSILGLCWDNGNNGKENGNYYRAERKLAQRLSSNTSTLNLSSPQSSLQMKAT